MLSKSSRSALSLITLIMLLSALIRLLGTQFTFTALAMYSVAFAVAVMQTKYLLMSLDDYLKALYGKSDSTTEQVD